MTTVKALEPKPHSPPLSPPSFPPSSRLEPVGKVHRSGACDPESVPAPAAQKARLRRPSSASQRWGQHLTPTLLSHRADTRFTKKGNQEKLEEVKVQLGMGLVSADS